jgi:deoxycytidylate deaminase
VDRRLVEDNASLHAERHALLRASHLDLSGSVCVVVGINKRDTGCPWSCCPCMSCARSLYNRGIESVIYPQRRCDGKWMVRMETPSSLLQRTPALQGDIDISPLGLFARQNQLAVVA